MLCINIVKNVTTMCAQLKNLLLDWHHHSEKRSGLCVRFSTSDCTVVYSLKKTTANTLYSQMLSWTWSGTLWSLTVSLNWMAPSFFAAMNAAYGDTLCSLTQMYLSRIPRADIFLVEVILMKLWSVMQSYCKLVLEECGKGNMQCRKYPWF